MVKTLEEYKVEVRSEFEAQVDEQARGRMKADIDKAQQEVNQLTESLARARAEIEPEQVPQEEGIA